MGFRAERLRIWDVGFDEGFKGVVGYTMLCNLQHTSNKILQTAFSPP